MSNFMQLVMAGEEDFGKVLAELLCDPVDRSLFDSGGIYGVQADRNAAAAKLAGNAHALFEAQPATSFKVADWGIEWYHSIYHWLQEKMEYCPDITRKFCDFVDFCYAHDNRGKFPLWVEKHSRFTGYAYKDWEEVNDNYVHGAEVFLRYVWQFWPDEPQDWFNMPENEWQARYDILTSWVDQNPKGYDWRLVSDDQTGTANTANGECMLDAGLLYFSFNWDGDVIYAISIHGGADVRGGYSKPIFCRGKEGWYDLAYVGDGSLWCDSEDCNNYWDTQGSAGYKIYHSNGDHEYDINNDNYEEYAERDEEGEMTGRLCCPVCRKGILHASF